MDELFPGRWRQYQQRPDSFAEQQAKFARLAGEAALDRGEHLVECLQSRLTGLTPLERLLTSNCYSPDNSYLVLSMSSKVCLFEI